MNVHAPEERPTEADGAKRRALRLSAVLACAILAPTEGSGQQIMGTVLDAETGEPVAGMEVVVRTPDGARIYRAMSSEEGRFLVALDTGGTYVLALSRIGFTGLDTARIDVAPGQNLFLELSVAPSAVGIDPIRVVVKAHNPYLEVEGFYRRMDRGLGKFVEREEIERYPSTWPTHLLRSMGVSLENGRLQGCRLLIDGMQIDWDVSLDDILAKDQMAAVEYHSLAVPVELRRHHGGCVVAIWTTWGEAVVNRRGDRQP